MPRLILDSGAVTFLAGRTPESIAVMRRLRDEGVWPPLIPSVVLVECFTGHPARDVGVNRFPPARAPRTEVPKELARRAAALRTKAMAAMARSDRKALPSAVDALVVAYAEAEGPAFVLTGDGKDLRPLADEARGVQIEMLAQAVERSRGRR